LFRRLTVSERRKKPGWGRVLVFVAVLAVILAAVVTVPLAVGSFRPQQPTVLTSGPVLRVSPSKLFTGELQRIEPHLGLAATGCVKLEPIGIGGDIFLNTWSEIRRAGQPPRELGSESNRMRSPTEASFSLREFTDTTRKKRYDLVVATLGDSGGTSTSHLDDFFPQDEATQRKSRSPITLREPLELSERVQVPVWAFVVNDSGRIEDDLQKAIDTSPCALVVYLGWEYATR
jgi:hypothetical protein